VEDSTKRWIKSRKFYIICINEGRKLTALSISDIISAQMKTPDPGGVSLRNVAREGKAAGWKPPQPSTTEGRPENIAEEISEQG